MDFDQALKKLEERFGPRSEFPEGDKGFIIASGGVVESDLDKVPALALTKGLAVDLWYDVANRVMGDLSIKAWRVGEVHVDTWRMTLSDNMNTHRIAEPRYSAQARIHVLLKTQAELDAEVRALLAPDPAEALVLEVLREAPPPPALTPLDLAIGTVLTDTTTGERFTFAGEPLRAEDDGELAMAVVTFETMVGRVHPVVGDIHRAPTGEEYVVLLSTGVKPEGEHAPPGAANVREAIEWWFTRASTLYNAAGEGAVLYWRWKPEIRRISDGTYQVYSRLLISKAEPLKEAV